MPGWMLWLCQFSIIAYAVLGGVFLAFSDFIMRSLSRAHGNGGVEVMQIINREVFRYIFIPLFLLMAPVSIALGVSAHLFLSSAAAALLIAAGGVYLVGAFIVTIAGNVPLNEALAKMDVASPETRAYWAQTYLPRWTFLNSVRTAACAAAAALCLFGLIEALRSAGA